MKATILILDTNNKGDIQYQNVFVFDKAILTAEELIIDRVCQEVEVYNQLKPNRLTGLVQFYFPQKNQKTRRLPKRLDYERLYSVALNAFANRDLSILVNDAPITRLNEEIQLLQAKEIHFLKYIPLTISAN